MHASFHAHATRLCSDDPRNFGAALAPELHGDDEVCEAIGVRLQAEHHATPRELLQRSSNGGHPQIQRPSQLSGASGQWPAFGA